jgi:hypothetical protein
MGAAGAGLGVEDDQELALGAVDAELVAADDEVADLRLQHRRRPAIAQSG